MTASTFLVVNDDGPSSPLLPALLRALQKRPWCSEVRFVVPAEERSWVAQAVTKFQPVYVEPLELAGCAGFHATGTPADCTMLGAYELYDEKPEFVISGVNLGTNAGLPFYLSSGTVGGASEGFLAGIKSVALSAYVPSEVFELWRSQSIDELGKLSTDWSRICNASLDVVQNLIANDAWESADFFSVNTPWQADENSAQVITRHQRGKFKSIFKRESGNTFRQKFSGFYDLEEDSGHALPFDQAELEKGNISITPIRYDLSSEIDPTFISSFES